MNICKKLSNLTRGIAFTLIILSITISLVSCGRADSSSSASTEGAASAPDFTVYDHSGKITYSALVSGIKSITE